MRKFLPIWVGQLVSLFGSTLTSFALGVNLYQETGSIFQFALISVFTLLPGVIVTPVTGPLIDRWGRKRSMILSDTGSAILTAGIIALLYTDRLETWHIYAYAAITSVLGAIQWPAYAATVAVLVPSEHLARANALVASSRALANLTAPLLAGSLIGLIGLWGVVTIDLLTFACAISTLALVVIPDPRADSVAEAADAPQAGLFHEALEGLRYILHRPGLLGLQIYYALTNFLIGLWEVLTTPLVLSFATPAQLGLIWSAGGAGILVGNLTLLAWGGPRRRIPAIFGASLIVGVGLVLSGLLPYLGLIALGCFLILCFANIGNGLTEAIWQSKVPPEMQGRVLSFEQATSYVLLPLSYLLAEPLVRYLFQPLWVTINNASDRLSDANGMGLLLICSGLLFVVSTIIGYLNPHIRNLEDTVPDFVSNTG